MTQPAPGTGTGSRVRPTPVVVASGLYLVAALLMLVQAALVGTYRDWMLRMVEAQFDLMNVPTTARVDMTSSITASVIQTGVALVLGAGLWVLVAVFVYRGKNWARVLALVFGMIGVIATPLSILVSVAIAPPPLSYFLTALPAGAAILAGMVLLWRPEAKQWCAPPPVNRWQGNRAGPVG